ncbi:flavin-containing monooxygenase 5-like [Watersipora subatra]|uniref:flavin-containing monooxygenase 5-like n=1 Tax=Watersipora subatra TaxID=2589382 RepID=UPI00355B23C6
MKVAIVGAGNSGILSLKTALDEGLDAVCYEMTDRVAGLWSPHKPEYGISTAYEGLITNSSKETMAFSEHPLPANYPSYLTRDMVYQYVLSYCKLFRLDDKIKLRHKVHSVTQTDDHENTGCWNVTVEDLERKIEPRTLRYDAVIICTGIHGFPYTPNLPGIDIFKGRIIHSHAYMGADDIGVDEKVLVLGNASSGLDMAASVAGSRASKQNKKAALKAKECASDGSATCKNPVYLSARSGMIIVQRDYANPGDLLLTLLFTVIFWILPKSLSSKLELAIFKKIAGDRNYQKYNFPEIKEGASGAICDDIWPCVVNGTVVSVPGIASFKEKSVVLSNGQQIDVDVVLMGTGYEVKVPVVRKELVDPDYWNLYKLVWPIHLKKNTLALVGFVRIKGASAPLVELQARWVAGVFSGRLKLPKSDELAAKTQVLVKDEMRLPRKLEVNHTVYCGQLAHLLGCHPIGLLFKNPYKCFKSIVGPALPYIYRLVGPGKSPDAWKHYSTARSRYHPFKDIVGHL